MPSMDVSSIVMFAIDDNPIYVTFIMLQPHPCNMKLDELEKRIMDYYH